MNAALTLWRALLGNKQAVLQGIGAPLVVVAILAMMVLPLPSWVLDVFFTLNIAVALMVMMVASYTKRALDFAVFPTVLLISNDMGLYSDDKHLLF